MVSVRFFCKIAVYSINIERGKKRKYKRLDRDTW